MNTIIFEDFTDLELNEFPYDRGHTALGEYHYIKQEGIYGNWYDPICLHQWRSQDGSWLVTSDGKKRYMEQNRGNTGKGAFENVYCCLIHRQQLYASYTVSFDLQAFNLNAYCGIAVNYLTSRSYDFIGVKQNEIALLHREEETFTLYDKKEFIIDDLETYHFKIEVSNIIKVFVNDHLFLEHSIHLQPGLRFGLVSKSACRYSDIRVQMTEKQLEQHIQLEKNEKIRIEKKRQQYPVLQCIHKIDLKNFGSGRQIRIRMVNGQPIFLIAQHQKRMIRDSYARLSCLTCFDYEGKILWQKGEPNPSKDNTLISCDLPFQIADINYDGKFEVIYSMDFMIYICDLFSGEILHKFPTPILEENLLSSNLPFHRLNVDAIRVADFEGLGYTGNLIIKDRYQNVWAYNHNYEVMWRYHHKNTGHFPYIYDFDQDGKDEMFVGYDLVDHDGTILWSLPMESDHTDEIIYARLKKTGPKRFILASGNEGVNIVNLDGTIFKHNEIGHAQRISVANYLHKKEELQILATAFWGGEGILCLYDADGKVLYRKEVPFNGNLITPVHYDGEHILSLLNASVEGGLIDGQLEKVVVFPDDGHPTLTAEVYDIDQDGIDEILCFDQNSMWIYKASHFKQTKQYDKYPDDGFSNYRGEYLIPKEFEENLNEK